MFVVIEMKNGLPWKVYGPFDDADEASEWQDNERAGKDCMILPVDGAFYRLKA
jgi:hypothetical protein